MQTRPPGRSAVVFLVLKMIVIKFLFFSQSYFVDEGLKVKGLKASPRVKG